MISTRTIAAAAAATIIAGLGAASATSVAAPTRPLTPASQYTRDTFDMTGTWKMVSTGSHTTYPGAGAGTLYTRLKRTSLLSPIANDPVYEGDTFSDKCELAGEFFVTPYVTPRGIVLTMWEAGNTEYQSDGSEAVYGLRSANSVSAPLDFTGTWLDSDAKLGETEMTRIPTRLFSTTRCS